MRVLLPILLLLVGCAHVRAAPPYLNGECPSTHPIKGNRDSGYYHMPGSQWYPLTQAERCFATEEDAKRAGFKSLERRH